MYQPSSKEIDRLESDDTGMSKIQIEIFSFDEKGLLRLDDHPLGKNWPVVYLIRGKTQLYIGETSSANRRFAEHLKNDTDTEPHTVIDIIFDQTLNKSAILDLEQNLIRLCTADRHFSVINRNAGQSPAHNYYHRIIYTSKIQTIWDLLKKPECGVANQDYLKLKNSDLFKYSPYTALTEEQDAACDSALQDMFCNENNELKHGRCVISGSAGTGKTIVAIGIIARIVDALKNTQNPVLYSEYDENDEYINNGLNKCINRLRQTNRHDYNIGFIEPMVSMRTTMKKVFSKSRKALGGVDVIGPYDVFKKDYDILIVDECHRLNRRKNLTQCGLFDKRNEELALDEMKATQLDWIVKKSTYQILFYDSKQTVRGSDMLEEQYAPYIGSSADVREITLTTQVRCMGGNAFIDYIDQIFSSNPPKKETIREYRFEMYDDICAMIDEIKRLDGIHSLCRNVAGFSWEWHKGKKLENGGFQGDIEIEGHRFMWNTKTEGWILSKNAIDEIGCVHTVQGFDLNYVGVIIGRDIDYDWNTHMIVVNTDNFYDKKAKYGLDDPEQVKTYIINAYKVLLTRGISGCLVYAYNEGMKRYLHQFIDCPKKQ